MAIDHDTLLRILLSERAKVLAFIRSIVRQRELAEDVFQDVCVIALEKRDQILDEQHLAAWLRTTARLRAMNVLRKQKRTRSGLDDTVLQLLEAAWGKYDKTPESAMSEALQACMESALTDKARLLVRSRYAEDLSVAEIAERHNRPVNSLYVTLSRIHATLADCVFRRVAAQRGLSNG